MEKLVRDKMPELCNNNADKGWTPMTYRIAGKEELPQFLLQKLVEEAKELTKVTNRGEMVAELADIKEVFHAIQRLFAVPDDEIESVRVAKLHERGGFRDGVIWDGNK